MHVVQVVHPGRFAKLKQVGNRPLQDVKSEHFVSGAGCSGVVHELYKLHQEEMAMEPDGRLAADEGDEEEEEHVSRLMALLQDVVRRRGGRGGATCVLRVDRRALTPSSLAR